MMELEITLTAEQVDEVIEAHSNYPQRFYMSKKRFDLLLQILCNQADKFHDEVPEGYNPYHELHEWFEGLESEGPEVRFIIGDEPEDE
jgi:hypothetical protein